MVGRNPCGSNTNHPWGAQSESQQTAPRIRTINHRGARQFVCQRARGLGSHTDVVAVCLLCLVDRGKKRETRGGTGHPLFNGHCLPRHQTTTTIPRGNRMDADQRQFIERHEGEVQIRFMEERTLTIYAYPYRVLGIKTTALSR